MSELLRSLNPQQRSAVVHGGGPLMVLAGAGTGKTRVLTHRISWLVEQGVTAPEILAVTFTNKASGEMRDRLLALLRGAASGMWIGTFHATCARLLRIYADRVGLTRDFTIFDDDNQMRLVKSILKELRVSERMTARSILSRIDREKNAGRSPEALQARDYIDDVARRVYPVYQSRLDHENAVDFNDLLLKVLVLFEETEVGVVLRERFSHVLVDEFQDTNLVQYRLVRHFAAKDRNLCVVGDDDQSIYGWRGAEPKNLLEFDHDFADARVVKLEQNYRSTGTILAAANGVICKNRDRHAKELWTEREGGEPVLLEECDDERTEADFVIRALKTILSSDGRSHGDFAILYRTHAQSRVFEESCRAHRVPYCIVGGVSFFQRREVKDITEYLRLLCNPLADSALERIINVPTRGIGTTTVERIKVHARAANISLLEATRSSAVGAVPTIKAAARRRLEAFVELIDDLRELIGSGADTATAVMEVIERTTYAERLEIEDKVDGPDRLRNVQELVAAAGAYDVEAAGDGTLGGFLERIALAASVDDKDGRESEDGQAVTMMTVHAAKGLEYPVVFVVGLEEGVFPSLRSGDLDEEIEEERRLAYVALTRAKDRAVLSYARTRRTYAEIRRNEPSRFIDDIPEDMLAVRARPRAQRPSMGSRRHPPEDYSYDQSSHDDEPVYYIDDDGAEDPVFFRGARVRHKIFGVGEIQEGSGRGPDRKLTIVFPRHGTKKIVARFVEKV